jgi:hypothetical protein
VKTVTVSIGTGIGRGERSGGQQSAAEFAAFVSDVRGVLLQYGAEIYVDDARAFGTDELGQPEGSSTFVAGLPAEGGTGGVSWALHLVAKRHGQRCIALTVGDTEFVGPGPEVRETPAQVFARAVEVLEAQGVKAVVGRSCCRSCLSVGVDVSAAVTPERGGWLRLVERGGEFVGFVDWSCPSDRSSWTFVADVSRALEEAGFDEVEEPADEHQAFRVVLYGGA